ncbi:MAG: hypothetical protein IT479_03180 [Xanthomonadales bacterium]|nr:hypothetical protein [Xanthomonadales bacterium]MCE7930680.1 tetratricopeptide repeat protein [Xanthomonadales bacterium PRO6]
MPEPRHRTLPWLLAMLAAALLIYWPALSGGFIYDDFVFIVENPAIHVRSLDLGEWAAAANGFPAAHQGRWLGMLSFAANHYVHGLHPFGYKLVNLAIHLLNGLLVWRVALGLLQLRATVQARPLLVGEEQAAIALAALWLILPINLTGAQYIGQRLESLSNTFVLFGLIVYLRLRLRDWQGEDIGVRLPLAILGFTGVGLLVKESAVLLPLYVACAEFAFAGLRRRDGSCSRPMVHALLACLLLPLLAGLYWLSSWIGTERSYSRNYDSIERLFTQARVLWLYVRWTLLPNLSELTLYHDDIAPSRGWLSPWSTLPAVAGIGASLFAAVAARRRAPLLSLGILWYFAGHALTATVIPLMLAFEHRNYFASFGLLLAAFALLESTRLRARTLALVIVPLAGFYAATTHLRAIEWSHPLRLAASEAAKRPDSIDAQFNYAHTLLMGAGPDLHGEFADRAIAQLEAHRELPGAGLLFDATLMILHARRREPMEPPWVEMMASARNNAPRISDVNSLVSIFQCMRDGACAADYPRLRELMELTLAHPQVDVSLYAAYAELVYGHFGDLDAALDAYARALVKAPGHASIHFNRGRMLVDAGRLSAAREDLAALRGLDVLGSQRSLILRLQARLDAAEEAARTPRKP